MLQLLIQLSILEQECKLVRLLGFFATLYLSFCNALSSLAASGNVFHEHQNLIDFCYILLYLGNIVLQNRIFYPLCTFQSLHHPSVFIADIPLNDG